MTVYAWDCSDFDWPRGKMDMAAAAADGVVMITHKATEAASTKHVHLADVLNRARAASIPILGAYHVVRSSPSVAVQVQYFLTYLDQQVPWWRNWPGFVLQVDLEKWPYDPVSMSEAPPRYLEQARPATAEPERLRAAGTGANFAAELRARKPPSAFVIVYASRGQYGDSLAGIGSPLWNANYPSSRAAPYRELYPGDKGAGWVAYSGQSPVLWQYSSKATIGSQPTCDANAFRGTLDQLKALVGISTGADMATGDADRAFAEPYTGTGVHPSSWMAKAIEKQLSTVGAAVGALKTSIETRDAALAVSLAASTAAITALTNVIKAGGGSIDSAAIIAAVQAAAFGAVDEAVASFTAQLAQIEAREVELKAALAAALQSTT